MSPAEHYFENCLIAYATACAKNKSGDWARKLMKKDPNREDLSEESILSIDYIVDYVMSNIYSCSEEDQKRLIHDFYYNK